MRASCSLLVVVLLGLALPGRAEDVVPDLTEVVGIKRFEGPAAAKALLKKNGFVVVPRSYRQIYWLFLDQYLPPFVTVDSVQHVFHVILEEEYKKAEQSLAKDLARLTNAMLASIPQRIPGGPKPADDYVALAEGYFVVAARLLNLDVEIPPYLEARVQAELKLIAGGRETAPSPLFGYKIDYSLFKPRSFYTETDKLKRFFRVMSWYGLAAFRLVNDKETRAAMLIAGCFSSDEAVRSLWKKLDRFYSFFLGPLDDLTPEDYAGVLSALESPRLDDFRRAARMLRDPKINNMVLDPMVMRRWKELTKGMRFLGKRYNPDGEVFGCLTHPEVPERWFPSALDVMAANGSERAREILKDTGVMQAPGYARGAKRAREIYEQQKARKDPTLFAEVLKLAETAASPPEARAPPFMKTSAYRDKSLMTGMVAWAAAKHTFQLTGKQFLRHGGTHPAGCVEPNLPFFAQMRRLTARTVDALEGLDGVDIGRFKKLDSVVESLEKIAHKQLEGKELTQAEDIFLGGYGSTISYLTGQPHTEVCEAYVADVHTEYLFKKCLEVAIGGAMPIYVITEHEGRLFLLRGGVMPYYEFVQPISRRLSDGDWRSMVLGGRTPPMPEWASSFVASYDADAVLAKLAKGEIPDEVLSVDDPRIEDFLKRAVSPGGIFHGTKQIDRALKVYALKAGPRAIPLLTERFSRDYATDIPAVKFRHGNGYHLSNRFSGAAAALLEVQPVDSVDALLAMVTGENQQMTERVVAMLARMPDPLADEALIELLGHPTQDVRWSAENALGDRGVKRTTRALLERYQRATPDMKAGILSAIGNTVSFPPLLSSWMCLENHATEDEMRELRGEIRPVVMAAIVDPDMKVKWSAAGCARRLGFTEAIPLIEKALEREPHQMEPFVLLSFENDVAEPVLLRLSYVAERAGATDSLALVLYSLTQVASPRSAPRARELLEYRKPVRHKNRRFCDLAARLLAHVYPAGPATKLPRDGELIRADDELEDWAERDEVIEAWKRFLDALPDQPPAPQ